MGRQKQSGLWVMEFWVVGGAWRAGPSKSPRQDEAAAVVRLVWPAGRRVVRVVWFAHGPLEDIAESEAGSTAEHGRARQRRPGTAIGWLQDQIRVPKVAIRIAWGGLYEIQW